MKFIISLCSFLQHPVTFSLLGSNILLSTLFSNNLNLRSSLNVRDSSFHTYIKQQVKLAYSFEFYRFSKYMH
jgi:hypothetical protein